MQETIKEVLTLINNYNYEAYLVGGAVRSILLNEECTDLDIATNCPQQELIKLFPDLKIYDYGASKIMINQYHIEFTAFRKNEVIVNGKPISYNYAKSIEEDALRRDITINAIYMDKDFSVYDFCYGLSDLKKKRIELIGDYERLIEDPLKMLRIIRFMITLDFHINPKLIKYIIKNIEELKKISPLKIKEELNKIFVARHLVKYSHFLVQIQLFNNLNLEIVNDNPKIIYSYDIWAIWAQFSNYDYLPFTNQEKKNITDCIEIINSKKITNHTLFKYGLYPCLGVAPILEYRDKVINKMYKELPIKNTKDLNITPNEILVTLKINKIGNLYNQIIDLILDKKLKNDNIEIKNYLLAHKEEFYEYHI